MMMKKVGVRWILTIAFLFFAGAVAAQPVRQAMMSKINGQVTVRINGGDWQEAASGMILHEKDEIRTGEGGYAELLLDEGGSTGKFELKEKSLLRLNTMNLDPETGEKVTLLDLAIGKVLVHAEKLKGDSKFEVRTPTSTTGVQGTVFEVSVEEKE